MQKTVIFETAIYATDEFKTVIDVINKKDENFTEKHRIGVINKLLSKEIDINIERDKFGYTALMCAVKKGYPDIIKLLVEKGAEVNLAGVSGLTPLHCAAQKGDLSIVEFLVDKGANVNQLDEFGGTSLHLALNGHPVNDHHIKVADYLIKNEADLSVQMNKDSWYSLKGKLPFPNIPEEWMKIAYDNYAEMNSHFTQDLFNSLAERELGNRKMAGEAGLTAIAPEESFNSYFD
ncbi:MAG: hypothetical protein K0R02_193 [Rickettsiaceae bacterium]|jgi:ankyrin repeat protein|nr:hypothetical protein [Rickettsiaceae bacterium]